MLESDRMSSGRLNGPLSRGAMRRGARWEVLSAVAIGLVAQGALGQDCLPDADGDGHPIFGNPEFVVGSDSGGCDGQDPDCGGCVSVANPSDLIVADLNGDGLADVVAINEAGDTEFEGVNFDFSVFLARGDGTFADQVFYPIASWTPPATTPGGTARVDPIPREIVAADLDGDGDLDLAISFARVGDASAGDTEDSSCVTVHINNGAGQFTMGSEVVLSAAAIGSVQRPQPRAGPRAADLDGDGDQDLVVISSGPSSAWAIFVLLNNGDGTFATPVVYNSGAGTEQNVVLGDVNGDAHVDLVVATDLGMSGNAIDVLLNDGTGVFDEDIPFSTFLDFMGGDVATPNGMALGDIDRDGDLDVVAADATPGVVAVYHNDGFGFFCCSDLDVVLPTSFRAEVVHLVDLDGDTYLDIVATGPDGSSVAGTSTGNEQLSVFMNDGFGGFGPETLLGIGLEPIAISSGDLDGDGDADVVAAKTYYPGGLDTISVLLNDGSGLLLADRTYPTGNGPAPNPAIVGNDTVAIDEPVATATADFNGDGHDDVATANNLAETVSILLGAGDGTLGPATDFPAGRSPVHVAAADLDGDMDQDLVVANASTNDASGNLVLGGVSILLNDGFGSFSAPVSLLTARGTDFVACADVDGDADIDVLTTRRSSSGTEQGLGVLFNNGNATFAAPVWFGVSPGFGFEPPETLAVGDIDGDSDLDVVVALPYFVYSTVVGEPGFIAILTNDGTGAFTFTGGFRTGSGPDPATDLRHRTGKVLLVDLDNDQDLDIAVSNDAVSGCTGRGDVIGWVAVALNDGTGAFGSVINYRRHDGHPADLGPDIVTADFNGDGFADIAAHPGQFTTNASISVMLNDGAGAFPLDRQMLYGIGTSRRGGTPRISVADLNEDGKPDLVAPNAAVDTVSVLINRRCEQVCPADIDGVPGVDVFDLLAYLDLWFTSDPAADIDGNPGVDVFDLLAYLDDWFSGCP